MTTLAIYPGTFDPITNGHINVIERAVEVFDEVVVAVASSLRKSPYIAFEERLQLVAEVVEPIQNVRVAELSGLLVDFAYEQQASCIIRGLRGASDFDYEVQLAGMNRGLAPDIETLFLPAVGELSNISGTMVREILELGGDISPFVPPAVVAHLKRRMH